MSRRRSCAAPDDVRGRPRRASRRDRPHRRRSPRAPAAGRPPSATAGRVAPRTTRRPLPRSRSTCPRSPGSTVPRPTSARSGHERTHSSSRSTPVAQIPPPGLLPVLRLYDVRTSVRTWPYGPPPLERPRPAGDSSSHRTPVQREQMCTRSPDRRKSYPCPSPPTCRLCRPTPGWLPAHPRTHNRCVAPRPSAWSRPRPPRRSRRRGPPAVERPSLSRREVEVLLAWLAAESKAEAAAALYITASTVNTHLTRIRAKYTAVGRPARSKANLFARAIQDGYTRLDEW